MQIRKSEDRGYFDFGWLQTHHSFSFSEYHDPQFMGFSALRVLNEDYVAQGQGFAPHSHRDMEIVTYILEGALSHKDSMGNGSTIVPGDVQYMSAGTGVTHSEFNHSQNDTVHLTQIWILPKQSGFKPTYNQKNFPLETKLNQLKLVVSGDGRNDSIEIRQDVDLYASVLEKDQNLPTLLRPGRKFWLQLLRGSLAIDSHSLSAGDALYGETTELKLLKSTDRSEFLLFDLP
jgi:redox-sensitive bicupin YhaK (pirin superfamily)